MYYNVYVKKVIEQSIALYFLLLNIKTNFNFFLHVLGNSGNDPFN